MRIGESKIYLENEIVKEQRMAWDLGYCVEVYRRRVVEEERLEREIGGI